MIESCINYMQSRVCAVVQYQLTTGNCCRYGSVVSEWLSVAAVEGKGMKKY